MRRIDYAARKDAINAQKRAAYAAKKEHAVLQKLNFADNVPQTERESIEKELSYHSGNEIKPKALSARLCC